MSPKKNHAAIAAALMLCALPGSALAASSTLQLIIGGEAYDGPPKFEVTFDGKTLGEGAVNAAIDTATVGRFADAADKTAYVQSFDFDIPEEMFKPGGEVRVRLVNEAYGGDGSNRDRNLYLAAVAVNGRAVTVSGLATQGPRRIPRTNSWASSWCSATAMSRASRRLRLAVGRCPTRRSPRRRFRRSQ